MSILVQWINNSLYRYFIINFRRFIFSYNKYIYLHTHNLSYSILNTKIDFRNLNFSLSAHKYGLVGNNGCGKSTLLKLLAKEILADKGEVFCDTSPIYISQNINGNLTFADVFDVSNILGALTKISKGSVEKEDFDLAENNWNIKAELEKNIQNLWYSSWLKQFYKNNKRWSAYANFVS